MIPYRQIGGFFLRLLVVYGLLVAAWPILQGVYSAGYRAVGNSVLQPPAPNGAIRLLPLCEADTAMDTEIHLVNRLTLSRKKMHLSSRLMGYLPTVEVIALILATPLPWSRKWKALLCGLILVHGLVLFRLAILILYGFSGTHQAALYAPGPFWDAILSAAYKLFAASFSFAFAAPILVWVLATFRRDDLERWRRGVTKPDV